MGRVLAADDREYEPEPPDREYKSGGYPFPWIESSRTLSHRPGLSAMKAVCLTPNVMRCRLR